jgi:hypothetical protein
MMANKSISNKKWEEVKTYFITNTAELIKGSSQSLRSMASRFGVNTSALIRKADALDENKALHTFLRNDLLFFSSSLNEFNSPCISNLQV